MALVRWVDQQTCSDIDDRRQLGRMEGAVGEKVTTPCSHAPTQMFSTEAVEPEERVAFWREVVCEVFLNLKVEPTAKERFAGSIEVQQWVGVATSCVSGVAQVVDHCRSDPRDDCLVSVQVVGNGIVSQAGRVAVLAPGDMALYDATRPYRLVFEGSFEQVVLQFPRQFFIDRDISIEDTVARRLERGNGLNDVAGSMVCALARQRSNIPAAVRSRLGAQAIDLVAMAFSESFGVDRAEAGRSAQRAIILEFVASNLADPDLSVQSIATAFGRTTRSLQYVFADEEPLRSAIRRLRLGTAAAALANPLYAGLTIGRIGSMSGFGDPAAFSRAFRREFGRSPSETRRIAS